MVSGWLSANVLKCDYWKSISTNECAAIDLVRLIEQAIVAHMNVVHPAVPRLR